MPEQESAPLTDAESRLALRTVRTRRVRARPRPRGAVSSPDEVEPVYRTLHAAALLLAIATAFPGQQPKLVTGPVDEATARANREWIEAALANAGTVKLPAGEINLDRAIQLGPLHSGCTLTGAGPTTILRNRYYVGNGPNETLLLDGRGVGYVASASVTPEGEGLWLDANMAGTSLPWDHPSAQADILRPGNVVFAFAYDSYLTQPVPPRKRYAIRAFDPGGRRLNLDATPDPKLLSLKWMAGAPIGDAKEGDRTVRLLDPGLWTGYQPGRYVYVTSGPSIANSSVGEHRRVLSVDPVFGAVTLDRPLGRAYTLAALVRMEPVANVTLKNLTLGQPANQAAIPVQMDFACDCTFDGVSFQAPTDAGQMVVGLNSCGRVAFKGCTVWGGLALNACHDITIDGGVLVCVMGEEGSTNCTVKNATVRADPRRAGQQINGVGWSIGSDRLTVAKTRIEGYGGGPQSPLIAKGRGLVLRDMTVANSAGGGGLWLESEGGRITRLVSDRQVYLQGGPGWKVTDSAAPYWVLWGGSGGTIIGCQPQPGLAPGWVIRP